MIEFLWQLNILLQGGLDTVNHPTDAILQETVMLINVPIVVLIKALMESCQMIT
jgi:hypothetical protein